MVVAAFPLSDENACRERINNVSRVDKIEDLQGPRDPPVALLSIEDPQDYFDSQQANGIKALGDVEIGIRQLKFCVSKKEAFCSLKDSISEINSQGFIKPIISPEIALKEIKIKWLTSVLRSLILECENTLAAEKLHEYFVPLLKFNSRTILQTFYVL